ncbi:MAG TPA: sulfatase-like hydrolase/transferase, partial [Pirellulales bacterium]|nr:sulfatase-like hydrolase/transferase [Pirellulales bacterium]
FNPGPAVQASDVFGLAATETTLPDRLKKLGYATGMVGKWHLGYRPEFNPLKRGFDEFFGFLGGAHSYVDSAADKNNLVYRNQQAVDAGAYLTDAFGRESVAFIDRHKDHPFFLYLAFNSVHAPLQAPEKYLQRFTSIADTKRRTFAAMLSAMDDNVGLVLDKLAAEHLDQQTLVFFVSDNGGPTAQTSSSNVPLRGFKAQVLEGGIRVPYMVQWKDKLPAGKQYDQPVVSLDIVPTALAAAGAAPDDHLDGVDLIPYLTGAQTTAPHENLYWRFGQQWAIRQGDFKLLHQPQGGRQLYDLAHDVGEQHNLVTERPELARDLEQAWQKWNSQLMAPRWRREAPAAKAKGKKAKARRANQGLSN